MNAAGKLLLVIGFVFSAGLLQAQAPSREKDEPEQKVAEKPTTVPFELLKSRHIAVQVKINGKGPYRLIFDTGAPTNIITNKLAKEAGVLKKNDKGAAGMFGMAGAKTIDTLEVGDAKLDKVQVMVLDHPTVAAISNALGPIDGLVGFPFFARFKTTIDYEKKQFTFEPNGYVPGDAMKALMDKMMSAQGGKQEPAIIGSAALWGFEIEKGESDHEPGVMIKDVLMGSPAARGGLKPGDRLLTLDGRWTDSADDTYMATNLIRPGHAVEVVVKRDGKETKLTVTPAKGF